jgi:hypothetical protein
MMAERVIGQLMARVRNPLDPPSLIRMFQIASHDKEGGANRVPIQHGEQSIERLPEERIIREAFTFVKFVRLGQRPCPVQINMDKTGRRSLRWHRADVVAESGPGESARRVKSGD